MSAELTGILMALITATDRMDHTPIREIWVMVDSQEALAQAGGQHRGGEHTTLQRNIHLQLAILRSKQVIVHLEHVKGHSNDPGNDAADWVANFYLKHEGDATRGKHPAPTHPSVAV